MNLGRTAKAILTCIFASVWVAWGPSNAADPYPSRPVKIVVPYPASGPTDSVARIVSTELAKRLGQPVIVENRPGAAAIIGTKYVVAASPDGYTLLLASVGPNSISPFVTPEVANYDSLRDLTPISLLSTVPAVIVVPANSSVRTYQELLKQAQSGEIYFGNSGVGSYGHLAGEIFNMTQGTKFVSVPYKGSSESVMALMNGSVNVGLFSVTDVSGHINSGKLRALAIFDGKRSALLPDVPTAAEVGFKEKMPEIWYGMMGPPNMDAEIKRKLAAALREIAQLPETAERLKAISMESRSSTPDEFAEYLRTTNAVFEKVVKTVGVKAN